MHGLQGGSRPRRDVLRVQSTHLRAGGKDVQPNRQENDTELTQAAARPVTPEPTIATRMPSNWLEIVFLSLEFSSLIINQPRAYWKGAGNSALPRSGTVSLVVSSSNREPGPVRPILEHLNLDRTTQHFDFCSRFRDRSSLQSIIHEPSVRVTRV